MRLSLPVTVATLGAGVVGAPAFVFDTAPTASTQNYGAHLGQVTSYNGYLDQKLLTVKPSLDTIKGRATHNNGICPITYNSNSPVEGLHSQALTCSSGLASQSRKVIKNEKQLLKLMNTNAVKKTTSAFKATLRNAGKSTEQLFGKLNKGSVTSGVLLWAYLFMRPGRNNVRPYR